MKSISNELDNTIHKRPLPPLIHVMARRLLDAKPLSEPMLVYFSWTTRNYYWNFNLNITISTQENESQTIVTKKQGSHTFSEMKFKDFSRIYQGPNYIFQALSHHYLLHCKCFILCWNNSSYTKYYNIHHVENTDHRISSDRFDDEIIESAQFIEIVCAKCI